jgi:hypothetical protein
MKHRVNGDDGQHHGTDPDSDAYFEPLVGVRLPGGCEACDAYRIIEQLATTPPAPRMWHIAIYHEAGCSYAA